MSSELEQKMNVGASGGTPSAGATQALQLSSTTPAHRLLQRDTSTPLTSRPTGCCVALSRQNDIVMVAQSHAQLSPLIKVPLRRHSSADALLLPHRPVLLERPGALN
jgi:hypothetical protein